MNFDINFLINSIKDNKMSFIIREDDNEYILSKLNVAKDTFEFVNSYSKIITAVKYINYYCEEHNLRILCVAESNHKELGKIYFYVLEEKSSLEDDLIFDESLI